MKKFIILSLLAGTMLPLAAVPTAPLEKESPGRSNLREIPLHRPSPLRSHRSAAMSLPASFPLSSKADIDACTTIDGNNDGKTWIYDAYAGNGGAACYEGSGTTPPADDYLVMGPVNFNAPSGNYSLTLQAKKLYLAETFEICLSPTGTAADAVSVFSCNSVGNDWGQLDGDFSIAAGEYYVMLHCTSPTAGISLYIRNLVISAAAAPSFTVPFEMVPVAEEARYFTFKDVNDDGKTWKYDTSNNGLTYEYNKDMAADDYVLFPEIEIPQAGNYKFSFEANGYGTSIESMEVLFGQGTDPTLFPEVFADKAVGPTVYRRQVVVEVTEPGLYRPALHCSSPANRYKLLTRNFRLEATDELPARHLPVTFPENHHIGASSAAAFSPAFILPDNSRVRITMEVKGAGVSVSMGNAPADAAMKPLFTLDSQEEFTSVSRTVTVAEGGIRYLGLASEGKAEVRNISLQTVSEGDVYNLPFFMQPTAEEFNEFQTVNVNGDDGVWSYYEPFGAARYNFSVQNDADDWLVLPAVNIPSTRDMIRMSLNVRGMTTNRLAETFEVWVGQTPEPASMSKVYSSPEILTETFIPVEFAFAPANTGKTYIAIRATSKKNSFHLFVRDIRVETDSRTTAVPRPVENLSATGAPAGSGNAVVSFTMPLMSEAGETLDPAVQLEATVSTARATVTLSGEPGKQMSAEIENGQGYGLVTVTAANSAGASNVASVRVYTGQDIPSPVRNLTATCSEDNRTMKITWEQPSEGANGGYADPAQMTFVIRHSSGGGSYTKAGTVSGVCEFTYTIPDSYPLAMHYLSVTPTNVAGECATPVGKGIMLGKPYEVPAVEEFADGTISLQPLGMDKPDERYTLDWYFENPAAAVEEAANASGLALIAMTEQEGPARGCVHLPKFDTRTDKGARLVLRLFNYPHFAPTKVSVQTFDGPVAVGEIAPAEETGWVTYSLPLPAAAMNHQWVEPVIDFGFDGSHDDEIWMLDAYGMEHYFDRELMVRATGIHTAMVAQREYTWEFTAGNYGREDVTFTVPDLNFTTYDGESLSFGEATRSGASLTLQPGQTTALTYKVTLDAGMEGDLVYDLTAIVDGDGDPDNNSVFGETVLRVQQEYVVRDLTAERAEDSNEVLLSWSAPRTDTGLFNCEKLESWDYSSSLGLFSNIDADGARTIGFATASFPGMGTPKGWQVWDYQDGGFDVIYAGYMGSAKSLIAFSPYDYTVTADDWLISPEVKGGTEVSFFVRPLMYDYGCEKIEIYVSSTGNAREDFTLLSTFSTKAGEKGKVPYWEDVQFTLPADSRFFAIRYASRDIFGLQLDDISYTPAQPDASALTYTVFRNGEAIATRVQGTGYTDNYDAPATYYVAAEKAYDGVHPLSNRADVSAYSSILTATADGASVTTAPGRVIITLPAASSALLVTPDGRTIFSGTLPAGTTTLSVPSGVCLLTLPASPARKLLVP